MNNHKFFLALLSTAMLGTYACNKDETTTDTSTTSSEVIEATLAKNTQYSYNLASSTGSSTTYRIINPSDAGASVDIATVQNVPVYEYTPAQDFVGTDLVQVIAVTDSSSNIGGCNGGGRTQHTDTLTFQMRVTEAGS